MKAYDDFEASAWSVCNLGHPSTSIVQYTSLFDATDFRFCTSITMTCDTITLNLEKQNATNQYKGYDNSSLKF